LVKDIIAEIDKASSEQATSIAEIMLGIEQISGVVQTNSATAEESAAASEELSSQATMLNEQIQKFRLTNTDQETYSTFGDISDDYDA
jgi:methyl-accepting chemotaxis protein